MTLLHQRMPVEMAIDWSRLCLAVDEALRQVATSAHVPVNVLRSRYVLSSMNIGNPNEANCLANTISQQFIVSTPPIAAVQQVQAVQKNLTLAMTMVLKENKKQPKFYCDIEAALNGELSDCDDELEQSKPKKSSKYLHVVRYAQQRQLACNVFNKAFVISRDGHQGFFRLQSGGRPPCFNSAHGDLVAMKPLEGDLEQGTPCVLRAKFQPLEWSKDGEPREQCEFVAWARGVVEKMDGSKAFVRLVDFGRLMENVSVSLLKPLPVSFDGPPLAYRFSLDCKNKVHSKAMERFSLVSVMVMTNGRDKTLPWRHNWRVIDVQKRLPHRHLASQSHTSMAASVAELDPVCRQLINNWLSKHGIANSSEPPFNNDTKKDGDDSRRDKAGL